MRAVFDPVQTAHGVAALRDLTPADVPAIVNYWTLSPTEYLAAMGVDRSRLGTAQQIEQKYLAAIRSGDPQQPSIALAITLAGRMAGYTLLNRYSPDVNISHWHLVVPELRGKGVSSALYPRRVQAYFEMAPIARLIHQTRVTNQGMNRVLAKFVPVAETKYEEKPDGVAGPGEFNIRYVLREDVPCIVARALELGILPRE